MNTPTLISIIVPVYNTAPYLDETLQSLCGQVERTDTGVQIEVICVNDGSTDGSADILRRWASHDPRIRVLHQPNQGQSVARNTALDIAQGEWIYFFDSDDRLQPDALLNAYWHARRTRADVVLFSGAVIDMEGHLSESSRYVRRDELLSPTPLPGTEVMGRLLRTFSFRAVPWLYLVRSSLLKQTGLRFKPGIIHEDELFTAALLLSCDAVSTLPETLVHHRMRSDSTMGQGFTRRNMDCYLSVVAGMEQWLGHHPRQRPMGRRYLRYTLTHVLITARRLPLRDRMATLGHILRHGYLPYVEVKRLLQFVAGERHT